VTDKRLLLALAPVALLAACGGPADEGPAASGEVLEGTISDAMLPVDRLQSEPPLEDPEAFAEAKSAADAGDEEAAEGAEGETADTDADAADETPAADPTPETED
jgi:hypothetical protein